MSKVYVVTNAEHGWDCVIGVFSTDEITLEQLERRFPRKRMYFVFEYNVESDLKQYED